MPPRRIDDDLLRELWSNDTPSRDIAQRMGVAYPAVNRRAKEIGLPKRGRLVSQAALPTPVAPRPAPPARQAARTSGYARINEIAAALNISLAAATHRYHRERAGQ